MTLSDRKPPYFATSIFLLRIPNDGTVKWENNRIRLQGLSFICIHHSLCFLNVTEISQVSIGLFFGFAMLATIVRITTRLWLDKRLRVDDFFLLSSCVCLIAATGLLYHGTPAIFFAAELASHPAAVLTSGLSQTDVLREIVLFQRINWSYLAISWASIFAVKFGFLAFFRHLVDRIPSMYDFWKGVVLFTGLVFAFSVCDSFIACPRLGLASCKYRHCALP